MMKLEVRSWKFGIGRRLVTGILVTGILVTTGPLPVWAEQSSASAQTSASAGQAESTLNSALITPSPPPPIVTGKHYSANPFLDTVITPFQRLAAWGKRAWRNFTTPQLHVHQLPDQAYSPTQPVQVTVDNAQPQDFVVVLVDNQGTTVPQAVQIEQHAAQSTIVITPPPSFRPGKYSIRLTDQADRQYTQDFLWGVLALNPDQSQYQTGETADIAMAVLDEKGKVICDAELSLTISSPNNAAAVLTTKDGITVNPSCNDYKADQAPDYEAHVPLPQAGTYLLSLTARTKNGNYSIKDAIDVVDQLPLEIRRETATRIYPQNQYQVKIHLTAHQAITGTAAEQVPQEFSISAPEGAAPFNKSVSTTDNSIPRLHAIFDGMVAPSLRFGEPVTDPIEKAEYDKFGLMGHDGLDFALPEGTDVFAADEGKVVQAGDGAYGTTVAIDHSWGRSYYGHLGEMSVKVGDVVQAGQTIGKVGHSGLAGGPQLHFSIKPLKNNDKNGYYGKIDPSPYLPGGGSQHIRPGTTQLSWPIHLAPGQSQTLVYSYRAPTTSPEFYLLGPLMIQSKTGHAAFTEARAWQIASDTTATIEQQINIIDKIGVSSTNVDTPTDNSLGLVHWSSSAYSNATVYFEADLSDSAGTATATLYTAGGSTVSGATVSTANTTMTRVRSAAITLTDNTDYTVRLNASAGTANMNAARLIIIQSGSAITATQTRVEVGASQSSTATTDTDLTYPTYFQYDSTKYDGSPTTTFVATAKVNVSNSNTALIDCGTAASNSSFLGSGTVAWGTPQNGCATSGTSTSTVTTVTSTTTSQYLYAYNFGSNLVPSGATIVGIMATVTRNGTTQSGGVGVLDSHVDIVKGGALQTATDKAQASHWDTTTSIQYGGSTDLWGTAWTASDINNSTSSGFGIAISAKGSSSSKAVTPSIDTVQMRIYYSITPTGHISLYDATGSTTAATLTTTSTSWSYISGSVTLTSGHQYYVQMSTSDATGAVNLANAKVIISQTAASGITKLETYHQYINRNYTNNSGTPVSQGYFNRYSSANWSGGTFSYYFESTLRGNTSFTGTADLTPGTLGTVSNTSWSVYALERSSSITPVDGTDYDSEYTEAVITNARLVIDVTSLPTVTAPTTLNLQVSGNDNDGADVAGSSTFHSTGNPDDSTPWSSTSYIAVGGRDVSGNAITTGFRFTGVTIPQGATITSASFDLDEQWGQSYTTNVKTLIYGSKQSDVSSVFSGTNLPRNITKTTASVTWNSSGTVGPDGTWYSTTSQAPGAVTSIIQEIVNQAGWASGNSLAIIVADNGSTNDWFWQPHDYESGSTMSAKLSITYTTPAASPTLDQLMRGGKWFNNGVKQPFTF